MAKTEPKPPGRCLLLELPPELRLHIYSYLDEITTFTVKHAVVLDKQNEFRLKNETKPPVLQSICRIIRKESWPLLYPAPRCVLAIRDTAFKAVKGKAQIQSRSANEKLKKFADYSQIGSARELVLRIHTTGRSGHTMINHLFRALVLVKNRIQQSESLQHVKIIVPQHCNERVYSRICHFLVTMQYTGNVAAERFRGGVSTQLVAMDQIRFRASLYNW